MTETLALLDRLIEWNKGREQAFMQVHPETSFDAEVLLVQVSSYGRAAHDLQAVRDRLEQEMTGTPIVQGFEQLLAGG